jgi:hypothetical protein
MNTQGEIRTDSEHVGSALVAGPFTLDKRPVDKRRPYNHFSGNPKKPSILHLAPFGHGTIFAT